MRLLASLGCLVFLSSVGAGCTAENPFYSPGGGPGPRLDAGIGGHKPVDLALPPEAGPPFAPSHVSPAYFQKGTAGLAVRSSIDTDALTVDGHPAPEGTLFVSDGDLAVLAVRDLSIARDASVRVSGRRPLVVIALGGITVEGTLDAGAHGGAPGPGGGAPHEGRGAGQSGTSSGNLDSGGGGGGYGAMGGGGGGVSGNCGARPVDGTPGGGPWGDPMLSMLVGGAGGGDGSLAGGCRGTGDLSGGAGGGAVQLTAGASIRISGRVSAGGGGGHGGCKVPGQTNSGSGAGGGAGGAILVESIAVDLGGGVLATNGGGGGGGAYYTAGSSGNDGQPGAFAAAGGQAGLDTLNGNQEVVEQRGGSGGTGGDGVTAMDLGNCGNGGGGGGAAGRIYLRSRGPLSMANATVSGTLFSSNNL